MLPPRELGCFKRLLDGAQLGQECVKVRLRVWGSHVLRMRLKELDEGTGLRGPGWHKMVLAWLDGLEKTEERVAMPIGAGPLHGVRNGGIVECGADLGLGIDGLDLSHGIRWRREDEEPGFVEEHDEHLAPSNGQRLSCERTVCCSQTS